VNELMWQPHRDTSSAPERIIAPFPRLPLCHLPTPLEPMPRLAAHLGGLPLFIKRDDATGLAFGGNKARKLEFELAHLLVDGVDTLVTVGAMQSNHARQTAAAAAKLGIACELVLEQRRTASEDAHRQSGNVLLDRLLGAALNVVPSGSLEQAVQERMAQLRSAGRRPAFVVAGASTGHGALGYAPCAIEMTRQATEAGVHLQHVFHATGSGGTQAGLLAGFRLMGMPTKVWGICHGAPPSKVDVVARIIGEIETIIECRLGIGRDDVLTVGDYIGAGYGEPTDAMLEAIALCATLEGIVLDPVYTGKAMAGLIDVVRRGVIPAGESVAFLHTGGAPGLFGYAQMFAASAGPYETMRP
jgi:L-cysteate sulfo-lyase